MPTKTAVLSVHFSSAHVTVFVLLSGVSEPEGQMLFATGWARTTDCWVRCVTETLDSSVTASEAQVARLVQSCRTFMEVVQPDREVVDPELARLLRPA